MSNYSLQLKKQIQNLQKSSAYQYYRKTIQSVLKMIDNTPKKETPSLYWQQELASLEYILDASPLVINKLRHHTHHITGLHHYYYDKNRSNKVFDIKNYQNKLTLLKSVDQKKMKITESPLLGGFGHMLHHQLYNLDTLKFYECLIALDKAGIIDSLKAKKRNLVLEIGAGWGGFAFQFKKIVPNTTYIIVDLPIPIVFSGTYLQTVYPNTKVLFIEKKSDLKLLRQYATYDFIFIPHYLFSEIKKMPVDLMINMVSFQEMTTEQVEGYLKKATELKIPYVYSLNRDRSPHNKELSSVRLLIAKYYHIKDIDLFPFSYLILNPKQSQSILTKIKKSVLSLKRDRQKDDLFEYHHTLGVLNEI